MSGPPTGVKRPYPGSDHGGSDDDYNHPSSRSPRTPEPSTPMKKRKSRVSPASPIYSPQPNFLQTSPVTPPNPPIDYYASHFRQIRVLGEGSFSFVYKVLCNEDGQYYAVKKTKQSYIGLKDRNKKLLEIQVFQKLGDHPNCLKLHEAWEEEGYLYMRTELCEKGSLRQLIDETQSREERLSPEQVWSFVADIARGLQHIHSNDLVHLDIKSANIFLGNDGNLKIGDFGLAFQSLAELSDDSEGDKIYLAPEVLKGNYGPWNDIYSFGCIVLELATSKSLPSEGEEWQMLRRGDFSSFPMHTIPSDLADLINDLMNPDPTQRPTAEEVLQSPGCQRIIKARKSGKSFVIAVASALFGSFRSIWSTSLFASAFKVVSPPPSPRQLQLPPSPPLMGPPEPPSPKLAFEMNSAPLSPISPDKTFRTSPRGLDLEDEPFDSDDDDVFVNDERSFDHLSDLYDQDVPSGPSESMSNIRKNLFDDFE